MSVVVVQQILTSWTKESRGGAGAVKRNAVPEVAPVPIHRIETNGLTLLHHKLNYHESSDFSRPEEEVHINPPFHPLVVGCVTLTDGAEVVIATFRYNYASAGNPDRVWARKTLHIVDGEWGQIVYNGRFTPAWEGQHWYEKMVVNVGLFTPPSSEVFTRCAPTYRFSAMEHLF